MILPATHELTFQLNAGAVDAKAGIIRGATVALSGVNAIGKFLCLDKDGNRTFEDDETVKRVPVFTDEKTLETLMTAAKVGGGVFRVRSDHDDALDSRAGFADSFVMQGTRVIADLHLNDSYRDRDIVLETAAKTPKLIGLSIDFTPSFEVVGDRAFMRVDELNAVDIVDAGAITPEGMFLARGVDKNSNGKNQKLNLMAEEPKKSEPTLADCMTAISALAATVGKLSAPAAAPAAGDQNAAEKKEELSATASAELKELRELAASLKDDLTQLKKEKAALGKTAPAAATNAAAGDDESTKEQLAAARSQAGAGGNAAPKNFLEAVESEFKNGAGALKRSDANRVAMKKFPKLYESHLAAKGVVRMTA